MASRAAALLFSPPPRFAQSFTSNHLHPYLWPHQSHIHLHLHSHPFSDLCLHHSVSHPHHSHIHLHPFSCFCLHHSASNPHHSHIHHPHFHPLNNNNQFCPYNSCQRHRSNPFIPPSRGAVASRGFRGTENLAQNHRTESASSTTCSGTGSHVQAHTCSTDAVAQTYRSTDESGNEICFEGFDWRTFTAATRMCLTCAIASLIWSYALPSLDLQDFWWFACDEVRMNSSAYAAGLFQMPPFKLNNRYFLVRAGESQYESKGIINTNPVAKTSIDSGLSEKGKRQTLKAAIQLKEVGACEGSCWIWPSITQRAYQAAEVIAEINNITRSRIVPEYSFLDARGLGSYEGRDITAINEVYNIDFQSPSLRPPPYTDGTPNESVADVFVRVTQLMSILETQYSGDNIIIVSPDSDNLSILQAGLTGLDLRRHSNLAFAPGEVRLIDMSSVPSPRRPVSGLIECPNPPACH